MKKILEYIQSLFFWLVVVAIGMLLWALLVYTVISFQIVTEPRHYENAPYMQYEQYNRYWQQFDMQKREDDGQ